MSTHAENSKSQPARNQGAYSPRPPSDGQRELLRFFGRSVPGSSREAFEAIQQEMSSPAGEMKWRAERARRCVAKMAPSVSGQGGHNQALKVACVLVQGFDLPLSEARAILGEWNGGCSPPWSDHELDHKIRAADKMAGLQTPQGLSPRGCLAAGKEGSTFRPNAQARAAAGGATETEAKKKVQFEPETLKRVAAPWADKVNLVWLANRSAMDPAEVSAERFLRSLYKVGEKVLCFTDELSQGDALWPDEKAPLAGPKGVWFLAQPVTGQKVPNPRAQKNEDGTARTSRRIAECVTAFRYMVLESDEAPVRDWLGFIVQMPLRIEALYTSGGRSVHALVRVDCATKAEWDAEKAALMPFLMGALMCGADRGTWSAVRLTRLPGCWRGEKGKAQKLLYFQPGAALRPLCEAPVVRDVEGVWCAQAELVRGDDDAAWLAWLRGGLSYYARVSERCAAALVEVDKRVAEASPEGAAKADGKGAGK